jgi:hypothetical protein
MKIRVLTSQPGRGDVIYEGESPVTIEVAGFKYSLYPNSDGSLKVLGYNGSLRIKPEGAVNVCSIEQMPFIELPHPMGTQTEEDGETKKDDRYDTPNYS